MTRPGAEPLPLPAWPWRPGSRRLCERRIGSSQGWLITPHRKRRVSTANQTLPAVMRTGSMIACAAA